MVELIWGKHPKACLLPLPAVKGNKTTINGTGGVVVKCLLLAGLVSYEMGDYKLAKDLGEYTLVMYAAMD
jgi:hypothetical protein